MLFQSTLSVRRATKHEGSSIWSIEISIHALRKESDRVRIVDADGREISIHALRKESDPQPVRETNATVNFNPRSP